MPPKATDIGVMVGRFQTPDLHEAHLHLLECVLAKHSKVILFLGVSRAQVTQRNPLDFTARKLMINKAFPDLTILPIYDQPSNEEWSKQLDSSIRQVYSTGSVTMYGGRDSFIELYKGAFACEELEQKHFVSATDVRKQVSNEVKASPDFRRGVIYAAFNQYPKVFPTVDIAVLRQGKTDMEVLLARKPAEKGWRFIGGFVDPTDVSLEMAARREVFEEANINVEGLQYIASLQIDDWRYRNEKDKIVTTFFAGQYVSGAIEPKDDIAELRWFRIMEDHGSDWEFITTHLEPAHIELYRHLQKYHLKGYTCTGTFSTAQTATK